MTDTTTGIVEHLDPHTLTLETNVRPSAPLTPGFVQSIRHNGVLTPVLAHRTPDGTVHVRAGQRRTLAAREAGVPTIPVYIVDADPAVTQRIIQQMIENDQRVALTDADRAAAFQQLAFEGLDVPTIAKRTGTTPKDINTALTVAGNEVAASAIQEHALTLDQAAALIDFDDDEGVRADLIEVATHDPAQFAHAVQRARDEHARAQVKADTEADLTARGFTILDRDRGYYDTDYTPLRDLITTNGDRATLNHIADVDGRAAFVRISYTGHPEVTYYLPDPKKAGLRKATNQSGGGPMTDEQKAERRTLIANNKAWASAEVVRREWLTTLLTRKTLPKDTAVVIARGLTIHRHAVSAATRDGNPLAHTLLGIEPGGYWDSDRLAAFLEQAPAKALHVALAVVLGAAESVTSKQTWRTPSPTDRAYLTQIAAWGYTLSDVEHLVTTTPDPDPDGDAPLGDEDGQDPDSNDEDVDDEE